MKHKLKKIIILISIISMFFTIVSCNSNNDAAEEEEQDEIPVEAAIVKKSQIRVTKEFTGKLSAEQDVMIIPKIPARVLQVYVDIGDIVKKGDMLFELCPSDVEAGVKQAEAAYNVAKIGADETRNMKRELENRKKQIKYEISEIENQLEQMSVNEEGNNSGIFLDDNAFLDNNDIFMDEDILLSEDSINNNNILEDLLDNGNLYDPDFLELTIKRVLLVNSLQQIEQALVSMPSEKIIGAQVNQARTAVDAAGSRLEDFMLYSPIDGIVSSVMISEGEMALQTMPPVSIINIDCVLLNIGVTEYEVNRIKRGDTVEVSIDALGDKGIKGEVISVSPSMDSRTQRYPVRIRISNSDMLLKPGMFARVELVVEQRDSVLAVPKESIVREGEKMFVFRIENGQAVKTLVETGLDDGCFIEIKSGLKVNDVIAVKGQNYLQDKARVAVMKGDHQ